MPLWLWQEVQILPWSTEIVALTCGTRNDLVQISLIDTWAATAATPHVLSSAQQIKPNIPIALIEAKDNNHSVGYAEMFPWAHQEHV
jgi:hypothetical protein